MPDDLDDDTLEALMGSLRATRTVHGFRARVIELGSGLENALDEVLADSLAVSASAGFLLRTDVLWRTPIGHRVGMLESLLDREGLGEVYGHVVPTLRRFFDLRNLLAHGYVYPVDPDEGVLRVSSVRRGRSRTVEHRLGWLASVLQVATTVETDLVRVWAGVVPGDEGWHNS